MVEIGQTRTVLHNDSPWKVAERILKEQKANVSSADIVKEMRRLAKLNGCKDENDFNKKFFSSTGKEYKIAESHVLRGQPHKPLKSTDNNGSSDSLSQKPDITRYTAVVDKGRNVVSPDSTKVKKDSIAPAESTRVAKNVPNDSVRTPKKIDIRTLEQIHADKINNLPNDTARIIEHNKTSYNGKYYGIVDKKNCKLNIYDVQGNVVKSFTVGIGKNKGDNLGSHYLDKVQHTKDAYKAEQGRYTTAGEFTLDEYKNGAEAYKGRTDGKTKVMALKGDNKGVRAGQMSIHMLYKPDYDTREAAINSKGLADNRMSYGCVNLKEEDYDVMHQYLGEGNKIYILPEEAGNKLQLEKQKDGSYKFEQTYHRNDSRSESKELASQVKYDIHPERDPVNIAKKDAAKKAREAQKLAQQKANETHWYDPRTWFS